MSAPNPNQTKPPANSLVVQIASKYGVEPGKLLDTLKATAFKQRDNTPITNEQMMALLVVANQYGLNPFTREIFAFPDKSNGIVPVVGVDGWSRIINDHPQSDGFEFRESDKLVTMTDGKPCPEWMEVVIYRKDRNHPIVVREHLDEVYQGKRNGYTGPWQTHTKRLMRHKTLIQGARVAYGFGGIYDEDEANRIIDAGAATVVQDTKAIEGTKAAAVNSLLEQKPSQGFHSMPQSVAQPAPVASNAGAPGMADAIAAVSRGEIDIARDIMPNLSEGERAHIETAIKNKASAAQ